MRSLARLGRDNRLMLLLAVLAPLVATLVLTPFRGDFSNTNAALILVLVILAIAATGNRIAGLLAALSAAGWFDFFLTRPYQTFTVTARDDVETTLLLLAVGVGVTEIALWGYHQQARAEREAAYLAGIESAAEAVAARGSVPEVIAVVSDQLTHLFGLRACRYEYGVAGLGRPARLNHNGDVERHGKLVDVQRHGLPTDTEIELLVERDGVLQGRFMLTAGPSSRPTVAQRLVAVTLADQVASAGT